MATTILPPPPFESPQQSALPEAAQNQAFAQASLELSGKIDEETLTVDVVAYTGAVVDRYSWSDGHYKLSLSMDPKHVRMGRLQAGAPVLKNHSDYRLEDVVGAILSPQLKDRKLVCKFKFANDEDGRKTFNRVKDGIYQNVSVGLAIFKRRELEPTSEGVKHFEAIDWEPQEVSIVSVPADYSAGFLFRRQLEGTASELLTGLAATGESLTGATARKDSAVDETTMQGAGSSPIPPATPVIDEAKLKEAREAGAAAERLRQDAIRKRVTAAGLDTAFADELCKDDKVTLELASERIFEKLAERSKKDAAPASSRFELVRDERETLRGMMANALLHKERPSQVQLADGARQFMGRSLVELARECVHATGRRDVFSVTEIVRLALHSSSDFPYILENVANKTLKGGYDEVPSPWRLISRRGSANDFKIMSRAQLGEVPTPKKVPESGEIKRVSVGEAKESYKIDTFAEIIAITRQAIINDDLAAFTRLPRGMGQAMARLEADIVWGLINSNPAMGDGTTVFHANHRNLAASGGAISVTTVGAATAAMRKQVGLDGKTNIQVEPVYIIAPVDKRVELLQYLNGQLFAATQPVTIPQALRNLEPITEARLDVASSTAWYLAANPNLFDVIEYAYLDGNDGVFTDQEIDFSTDGISIKARLDFGAKILDWRGLYKNPGA